MTDQGGDPGGPGSGGDRRARSPALWGLAWVGVGVLALGALSAARAQGAQPAGDAPGARSRASATERFSLFIDDLPIMPGLREAAGDGFSFEVHAGGRLAKARLLGPQSAAAVRSFYAATLGRLGWRATVDQPFVFHRGRERLTLLLEPAALLQSPGGGRAARAARTVEAVFVLAPEPAVAAPPAAFAPPEDRPT